VTTSPPDFTPLISSLKGNANTDWLTLRSHIDFREEPYAKLEVNGKGTLSMWTEVRSYILPKSEKKDFLQKIDNKTFFGNGCDYPSISSGWLGEFPWSSMIADSFENELLYGDDWFRDIEKLNAKITICDIVENGKILPSIRLAKLLNLSWSGKGYDFINESGNVINQYLKEENGTSSSPLLINKEALIQTLNKHDLEIVWCCLSEKMCYDYDNSHDVAGKRLLTSAVYHFKKGELVGDVIHEDLHEF